MLVREREDESVRKVIEATESEIDRRRKIKEALELIKGEDLQGRDG